MASDADVAARLIERLLADPAFRAQFLRDPPESCRAEGLDRLADELARLGDDPVEALESRESRSSLGGVVLVAAMEGVGLYEVAQRGLPNLDGLPTEVADVLSRVNLPAVDADAAPPLAADASAPPTPATVVPEEEMPGYREPGEVAAPVAESAAAAPEPTGGPPPDPAQFGADGTGGPPSAEATAVLGEDNIVLDETGRKDFSEGRMDPRVASVLLELARDHQITVSSTASDHSTLTAGGSVSNHSVGRGLDIAAVDGEPVSASSAAARLVAGELAELPQSIRPTEVGTPWSLAAPGFFTDSDHQDHLHVGFDGDIAPDWKGPGVAEAAPAPAPSTPVPDSPGRRYDSLMGPAVATEEPRGGEPQAAEVALSGGDYPGPDASKAEYAAWMGAAAAERGLPPELPVMAALVESGLANLSGGHADSVGFFQMRVSFWNQGEYAGYPDKPQLQLKWFLDQAEQIKELRISRGQSVTDPGQYGTWIADVERPAEEFRHRYQLRLSEAQGLLEQGGDGGDAAAEPGALAAIEPDAGGQGQAGPRAMAALAEAKKYLGTPYLWGGSKPETGFDCSGLMQWAYAKAGIEIPRVTYDQIEAENGTEVGRQDLRPGDLVFFADASGDVHHVGMSLGGDKFLHAPRTGDVVKISSLDESYYASEFAGGRRFDDAPPGGAAAVPDEGEVASARAALDRDAAEVARHDSLLFRAVQVQEQRKNASFSALRAVDPEAARQA